MPKVKKQSAKTKACKEKARLQEKLQNPVFSEKLRKDSAEKMRIKRLNDPNFKEAQKFIIAKINKRRKDNDPEFADNRRQQINDIIKEKMLNNAELAENRKQQINEINYERKKHDETFLIKCNKNSSKTMKNIRKNVDKREVEKEKDRSAKKDLRKQNEDKKTEKTNKAQEIEQEMANFCRFRLEHVKKLQEALKEKNLSINDKLRIKRRLKFNSEIKEVPSSVCCCCECTFSKDSVLKFDLKVTFHRYSAAFQKHEESTVVRKSKFDRIKFKDVDEFKNYIVGFDSGTICRTCKRNLDLGQIPQINPQCGIKVPKVREEISSLTDLEERFVSPIIPFMQLKSKKQYSHNPQLGIKGAVINIVPKMHEMYEVLPRKFNQMNTIQIDFKRDLSHKTSYMRETVSVSKIMTALKILVEQKGYQQYNIKINEQAFEEYDPKNAATQFNFIDFDNSSINKNVEQELNDDKSTDTNLHEKSVDVNLQSSFPSIVGTEGEFQFVLFENMFTTDCDGIFDFTVDSMCAYNSWTHGLIASYKRNKYFHDYVESNKGHIELFKFLSHAVKIKSSTDRNISYMKLLYEYTNAGLKLSDSEIEFRNKSMAHDCSEIIERLLGENHSKCIHPSFKKYALCNKIDCEGTSSEFIENCMIVLPLEEEKSLIDLEKRIKEQTEKISRNDIFFNCDSCKSTISNNDTVIFDDIKCQTEYGDMFIVNVISFTKVGGEAIRHFDIYKDVPDKLSLGSNVYELSFFIHKSRNHYRTFYKDNKDYILLDDNYDPPGKPIETNTSGKITRCEKLVEPQDVEKGVNPSILVYFKYHEPKKNLEGTCEISIQDCLNSLEALNMQSFKNLENENKISSNNQAKHDEEMIVDDNENDQLQDEIDDYLEEVLLVKNDLYDEFFNNNGETDISVDEHGLPKFNVKVIAPGQGQKPISYRSIPHIVELSFPKTYGGNVMTYDRTKITIKRATRAEVKNHERRCSKPNVLLCKWNYTFLYNLGNCINIALRKTKGKNLTAKDVRDGKVLNNNISKDIAYRLLPTIRTGPMYLKKKMNHATAMIRQIDVPSVFLTVSQGEHRSAELMQLLHKNATGEDISPLDALNLSIDTKSKYVRNDPVTCAEYFNQRVKKLDTYMNDTKGHGLFGEKFVTAFIKRKECQGRGSMHSHQILYLKDAPKLIPYEKDEEKKKKNEKEIVEFYDKIISTEYLEDHPNMVLQIHSCRAECRKGNKGNTTKCRFGYPKCVSPETKVMYPMPKKERTSEMVERLRKIREKMSSYRTTKKLDSFDDILKDLNLTEEQYYEAVRCSFKRIDLLYKRDSNSVGVNTYNPILLDEWEANHDIQACLDPYGTVVYLVGYSLKADEGMLDMLSKAQKECREGNKSLLETLRKVSNAFHNSSFVYAQQAVEDIEGIPVLKFSHAEKFINTNRPENRIGIRKSMKELKEMDDDDDNIIVPDFISQYSKRPKSLENVCLADFAALYKRKGEREVESDDEDSDDDENNPKRSTEYVLRTKERIIRYVNFKREIDEKEYMREMVMLYYPWRKEEIEILDHTNVAKTFTENTEEILQKYARYHSLNLDELEKLAKEVEEHMRPYIDDEIDEFQNMEDETAFISKLDVFKELGIVPRDNNSSKSKCDAGPYSITRPAKIDINELYDDLRKLNELQQQFVQHVFHIVKTIKEHESFPKIILLGAAGTGKSLVLRTLNQLLTHYYDNVRGEDPDAPKVLLAAYTGIAAFLIGGNTCHHAFALKIAGRGKSLDSDSTKNTIRAAHREIKAIIIDELSFISNKHREAIDNNCRRIYGNNDSFGGKLVILMGDLFQLPPVCGQPIYRSMVNSKKKGKGKDLMPDIDSDKVWNEFKLFELKEIVRQKNVNYQTALNNLALGKMTEADIKLINERVVAREEDVPSHAFHLFASNAEVDSFNAKKIHAMQGELYEVDAIDEIKSHKVSSEMKQSLLQDYLQPEVPTVNLKHKVLIKQNIRYMITINIDVSDGLVNGARATLMHISFTEGEDKEVLLLWMKFRNSKVGSQARMPFIEYMKANNIPLDIVPIQKESRDMTTSKNNLLSFKVLHEAFRTQFPVTPCEGTTIHKTQGDTLECVCVDLRYITRDLSTHLKYVALSRCDYEGLYILGKFKPSTDNSANEAIAEIKRLREEAALELSYYNFEQNIGKKIVYHNVRSFNAHKFDIKSSNWYWKADVIILTESNVNVVQEYEIRDNFEILYPNSSDTNNQRAKYRGIIILSKMPNEVANLSPSNILDGITNSGEKWHIDLRTFTISDHYIITGYKSPKTPNQVFIQYIESLINRAPKGLYITIIGDFNFDMFKENSLKHILENRGLKNCLGENFTTDFRTQIDIVYSTSLKGKAENYASYFSDHFAIWYQTVFDKTISKKSLNKKNENNEVDHSEKNIQYQNDVEMKEVKTTSKSKKAKERNVEIASNIMKNNHTKNSSVIFDNSIITFYRKEKRDVRFYNLCPFNSVCHGFLELAKNCMIFQQIIQSSIDSQFYAFLTNILNNAINNKDQTWINLIVEVCWDILMIDWNELLLNQIDMANDVTMVLNEFFKDHISIFIENSRCNNIIKDVLCDGISTPITLNMITLIIEPGSTDLKETLVSRIRSSSLELTKICQKCKQNILDSDYSIEFGDLVIIAIHSDTRLNISDFPSEITQGSKTFELKLLFNHPDGHFYSIFRHDNENFIILDDLVKKEKKVKSSEFHNLNINIKAVVYLKSAKDLKKKNPEDIGILELLPKRPRHSEKKISNAMMDNTIKFESNNVIHTYLQLCVFNSFLHGMIASYNQFSDCAEFISENRINLSYFDILLKIMQVKCSTDAEKLWIEYIVENVPKENFNNIESNQQRVTYLMRWNADEMVSTFFKDFISYKVTFECTECGFQKFKNFNRLLLSQLYEKVHGNESEFCKILEHLIGQKMQDFRTKCSNCKTNVQNFTIAMNKVVIVITYFNRNIEIPLDRAFRSITINGTKFDVMFYINYKDNDHYNTFVNSTNGDCIYIDDFPRKKEHFIRNEKMKNWKIYPLCIVLIASA